MKRRKIKNITHVISFILFFGLLVSLPLITVFAPKDKFSETENRYLEEFPKFSTERVFNRKFMNGIETYLADHFVGRTSWIKGKTSLELLSGKEESNGIYITAERLLEKLPDPNFTEVEKSIAAINNFAERYENIQTFLMIVPTATGVYGDTIPKNAPNYNQEKFISSVYEKTSESVISLDAYGTLSANRDQYIYYRNDHHWTSLGAYLTYAATIKRMGYNPIPYEKFDIEHAASDFKGTLFSKALYDNIEADAIDLYHYNSGVSVDSVLVNTGKEINTYDSLYFKEYLDKKDKYSTFCGSNQPIVTIKTDAANEKKLLILKDSYAHCYVPFLSEHYSEIVMVDMRYINMGLDQAVNIDNFDQALFLYNCASFASEENIKKLDY